MEVLKQKQGEEAIKLEKRKKAIDIELSDIEPLIREAKDAVGNIKPDSLSEIRSLRMPPDVIRDILEAVLRLMGIFDTSWVSMKRYCSLLFLEIAHVFSVFKLLMQRPVVQSLVSGNLGFRYSCF